MDNRFSDNNRFKESMLQQLRDRIEEDCCSRTMPGTQPNRVAMRHFMIFLLFGSHSQGNNDVEAILYGHVRDMLSSTESFTLFQADSTTSPDKVWEVYDKATINGCNIENNNTVILYPVFILKPSGETNDIDVVKKISTRFLNEGRTVVWQPFIIAPSNLPACRDTFLSCAEKLKSAMDHKHHNEEINNACVLSTSDERGMHVPVERLMQTVAVTAVLFNAAAQEGFLPADMLRSFRHDPHNGKYLFTSRSVSVTHPIRTLMLNRLLMAIAFFSGDTDQSAGEAMNNIDYTFIRNMAEQNLAKLPHRGDYIDFMPLAAVMPGSEYEARLRFFAEQLYWNPVCSPGAINALKPEMVKQFFHNFFQANGSLTLLFNILSTRSLRGITERGGSPLLHELEPVPLQPKELKSYKSAYDKWGRLCLNEINDLPKKMVAALEEELQKKEYLDRVREEKQCLDTLRSSIQQELSRMANYELCLENDPRDWFETFVGKHRAEAADRNRFFDNLFASAIINPNADKMDRYTKILDLCYQFLTLSIVSHDQYMNTLSEKSREQKRVDDYFIKIREHLLFTVPLLMQNEQEQANYIIGNPESALFNGIAAHATPGMSRLPVRNYDRIDLLRVSATFSVDVIKLGQPQAQGGEEK